MIRTNEEIYDDEMKKASGHFTHKQIALNAMFVLRKEIESEAEYLKTPNIHLVGTEKVHLCIDCLWGQKSCGARPTFDSESPDIVIQCKNYLV